jgi:hypothetical protein
MTDTKPQHRIILLVFALSITCLYAVTTIAQNSTKTSAKISPPTIGSIKDYPATGLMTGCGNLYFYRRGQPATDANYVFLARGDGSNAWMNLNGRDVHLQQIKRRASASQGPHRLSYRHDGWQITVVFEAFKAKTATGDTIPMFQMKITVRKGRAVRVGQAVGASDC